VALDRVAVSEAVYRATIVDSDESWLVSRRVGLDDDVRVPASVAAALGGRELALLPRGGVAAPLDAAATDRRPARRAFCFLPLPLKTGLPVHVNAHFALDHEARRCLWPDDDAGAKADWNYRWCATWSLPPTSRCCAASRTTSAARSSPTTSR